MEMKSFLVFYTQKFIYSPKINCLKIMILRIGAADYPTDTDCNQLF